MKLFSNRHRPLHLGPFPLEGLPRLANPRRATMKPPAQRADPPASGFGDIVRSYLDAFLACDDIPVASERVPLPPAEVLTHEIKSACYFLDAAQVGVCEVDDSGMTGKRFAIVMLVEHGRQPERRNRASDWVEGTAGECSALRGAEIAVVVAGYLRQLGYEAHVQVRHRSETDLGELAFCAGLVERRGSGFTAPFIGTEFAIAAVVTSLPLLADRPLAPRTAWSSKGVRLTHWLGLGGTRSALERWRLARRASHLGKYPMEKIRRRDTPTTLIFGDEVPRVPLRASFFNRAQHGDLGEKTQRERSRFATKHPLAYAMTPLMQVLVSRQDGPADRADRADMTDAAGNARAVKAVSYFLGADMVGICEAPPYAWYSHGADGRPIDIRHRYAVVLVIDQGQETTEGTSGDDWISGSQSMRAYLRGAEIAALIAAQIRRLGHPARAHTNRDSEVLHLPLLLHAGLGELSRIGELVLNPFLGPRFKSVVITTDMPLEVDRPIDFGLQDTCSKCQKCARECPCNAIS